MTGLERKVQALASAANTVVYVGSRGDGKGFFAHCAGTEIEAGSMSQAITDLVKLLVQREEKLQRIREQDAVHAAKVANQLRSIK